MESSIPIPARAPADERPALTTPERLDSTVAPGRAPVRVLIVDDRAENLLATESLLRHPDYELVLARSGADALRFLLHDDCALILMDVQMPQLDGVETARLIRQNPRTRTIPIVFLTAVTHEPRFIARGYDAGAIDYLVKPVDPDVLRAKVSAFAELHRSREEALRNARLLQEQERRERQRALAELEVRSLRRERSAQERYRRLVDGITHAIVWTIDRDTLACTFVSPSAGAILGYPSDRWTDEPEHWQRIVPDEDRAVLAAVVRGLLPGGPGAAVEHAFIRADGQVSRFETDVRVVPSEDEGRFEVRGFSVDVTDARQAEEALAFLDRAGAALSASLDLDRTVTTAARVGVPFLADACVVAIAPVAPEVQGATAIAPADGALERAARAVAADPALGDAGDGRFAALADDVRPCLGPVATAAVEALDAGPVAVVTVPLRARDRCMGVMRLLRTTRRRFGPRELRLAEELGRRAAAAIDHALLYREARDAIAVRDEFISIASHELRTPLTPLHLQTRAMQHALEALPEGAARDGLRERLASSARQVERITRLVANLLDVTRIHAGQLELEREPLELGELISDAAGRFRDELARAGRELQLEVSGPLTGSCDRIRIDQVVTNLVSNAVRYGGNGPVAVRLRAEEGTALISIADRGAGIAEEELGRIFERYHKGATARAHGGLGLGLFITRRIVEAHGGRIRVASNVGEGTTFTVELPLGAAAAATAAADAAADG